MENASKALLIAGQVLIAILLLTLFSYLFTKMNEDTSKIREQLEQNEKLKFNQQFLVFDQREITAQDVATIMNLAKENNTEPKFPTTIEVKLNRYRYNRRIK